jgi:hypothetical protein
MLDSDNPAPPSAHHHELELSAGLTPQAGVVADKPPTPSTMVFKSDGDECHAVESAVVAGQGDGSEAIRIAREGGGDRSASADRHADGSLSETVGGPPPRKGQSEMRVAHLLVESLNRAGESWGSPISCDEERARRGRREDGVDCRCYGPNGTLQIQVTTPEIQLWAPLHKTGQVSRRSPDNRDLVSAIWTAIEKKKLVDGRQGVVLALDATDCPAYSFRSVVAAFQRSYGRSAAVVGYKAIWMVGPSLGLVQRLDTPLPECEEHQLSVRL